MGKLTRKRWWKLSAAAIVWGVALLMWTGNPGEIRGQGAASGPIEDPVLEQIIRQRIGKTTGALTKRDLRSVKELFIIGQRVKSLEGLEQAENLKNLALFHTDVSDIRPLKELSKLETLLLENNPIKDFSPLREMNGLRQLRLNASGVRDRDLSFLRSMGLLEYLSLNENEITSLYPLRNLKSLKWFFAERNQIESIQGMENWNNLQTAELADNRITNVEPLMFLPRLNRLDLSDNPLPKDALDRLEVLRNRKVKVISTPLSTIQVFVDGERMGFQSPPFMEGNTVMVPLRPVVEPLGWKMEYRGASQTVIGTKSDVRFELGMDQSKVKVNGITYTLGEAPRLIGGITFVPADFISLVSGRKTGWDIYARTLVIGNAEELLNYTIRSWFNYLNSEDLNGYASLLEDASVSFGGGIKEELFVLPVMEEVHVKVDAVYVEKIKQKQALVHMKLLVETKGGLQERPYKAELVQSATGIWKIRSLSPAAR